MLVHRYAILIALSWLQHLAASADVDASKPEQVHIAFGDDPTTKIVVTWNTASAVENPEVRYGEADATNVVAAVSRPFVDGGPKKRTQIVHRAALNNLKPATKYVYKCGSGESWSEMFSFRTANDSSDWSPTVAVYGDMGLVNFKILPAIEEAVKKNTFDAIIHVGDFGYDMRDDDGKLGDTYMKLIEPVAANIPYMVCPGNHESHYNFSHYKERFTMPGDMGGMYFSFDLGPAHFISLNTEAYYFLNYGMSVLLNQYNWLIEDLKEANKPENREKRPWIIVYGHHPMYCSNLWIDDCSHKPTKVRIGLPTENKNEYGLEKLFYDEGVDLELWGHQHAYERLWPVYDYEVKNGSITEPNKNPKAPIQITTGSAGSKYEITKFPVEKPYWTAARVIDYSYTILKVHNKTHLHVQQISTDQPNKVMDDVWIVNDNHGPYAKKNENN